MAKKFLSNIELDAGLVDVNGNTGTSGQILSSTGAAVDWIDQGDVVAGEADKALSLTIRVKNTESVALTKGQVVCAAPSATPPSGNVIEVKRADNNGTDSMPAIGVLNEGLDAAGGANDEGEAIMFGRISGINTSAFSVGDEVFVSDTPGGLTAIKPTGEKYIQKIGVVMRDDASNGTIEVFGAGRTNDVPTPLYIDHANQRVGIGEINPDTLLHIAGNNPTIKIEDNYSVDYYNPKIEFFGSSEGGTLEYISNPGFSGMRLHYRLNATNQDTFLNLKYGLGEFQSANITGGTTLKTDGVLQVTGSNNSYFSNGYVGIGTTSPRTKLHISGLTGDDDPSLGSSTAPLFVSNTANSYGLNIGVNNVGTSWLQAQSNTSATAYSISLNPLGGNVGIGTTSPSRELDVYGNIQLSDPTYSSVRGLYGPNGPLITFNGFNFDTLVAGGTIRYNPVAQEVNLTVGGTDEFLRHSRQGGYTTFTNNNSERMRITSSGNVGIGTTSPSKKLDVVGDIQISDAGLSGTRGLYAPGLIGGLITYNPTTTVTEVADGRMIFNLNSLDFELNAHIAGKIMTYTASSGTTAFYNGPSEAMRLTGLRLGIGTTSPSEKLEVNGNIRTTNVTITQGTTVTYSGGGSTYETLGPNVAFARGTGGGAMYNPLLNPGGWDYAGRDQAPIGLLFNTDGWTNLTNIQERNYQGFVNALGNQVGSYVVGKELIMWDYLNDNYYKLKFTYWQQGGGGGYTYQRTPLTINNKRSIATDTVNTNKIVVGNEIQMQAGIRLKSDIWMSSPSIRKWSDMLVDPNGSTVKIVTSGQDIDNDKVTEDRNIRIGHGVGENNTSSNAVKRFRWNVLIGNGVAQASTSVNTYSYGNVFLGHVAGYYLGQGGAAWNTGIGSYALYNIQGGDFNATLGYQAGYSITSGSNNTFLGRQAGYNLSTGTNNAGLGYDSRPSSSSVSNTITLGNSSITTLRCQVTSITSLSDQRDKTNIEPSTYGLNVINKLNPVTFDWDMRDGGKVGDKDLGFIAQDLQQVDDENLKLVYDDNPEKLEASYGRLIPVMAKAIQELSAKIEELQTQIQTLKQNG